MRSRNPTIYEIIPQIYDGMLDPTRLACVGESIVQLVGGHTGALVSRARSTKGTVFSEMAYNVDLGSAKAWETTFSALNPFRREENLARPGDVLFCSTLVSSETYKRSVFYNEWARRRDHFDSLQVRLSHGHSSVDYYTILKSHRAGLVKPREVEHLKLLAPHLVRAYTTSALVNKYRAQAESLGALIANAGFGIVLVTPTRRVVYSNATAEAAMRKRSGLCYAHGRVGAVEPQADKKLEALVLGASRPQQNMMQAGSIPLTDEDGSISRVIHVVPLSASSSSLLLDQEHPSVGIFVVDLCRETTSDRIKSFAMLYRLTPGESRLMANLISGEGMLEAAERLNITEGTARTHLKHIFAKTDTHRQAELLRLFFEATIPFEAQQASTISCRQYF